MLYEFQFYIRLEFMSYKVGQSKNAKITFIQVETNCMRGDCILNEVVRDISCSLKGQFCGNNMKFTLLKRHEERYKYISFGNCIVQCKCIEGYKEENGQCIRQLEKAKNTASLKILPCKMLLLKNCLFYFFEKFEKFKLQLQKLQFISTKISSKENEIKFFRFLKSVSFIYQ